MDPYEGRMAEGWQALTLQTSDVIVRVEDTGQLVNMSALKRRHDRECGYSRGGRLFLTGRVLSCQYGCCPASMGAASSNGSGSRRGAKGPEAEPEKPAGSPNARAGLRRTTRGTAKSPSTRRPALNTALKLGQAQ